MKTPNVKIIKFHKEPCECGRVTLVTFKIGKELEKKCVSCGRIKND